MPFKHQLLIKSLLPALIGLSIIGCKSSSSGSRVTTTRSKTGSPKATPEKSTPTLPGTTKTDSADTTKTQTLACGDYSKKMEDLGWKSLTLDANEQNKKLKISYFVPENSDLKNPVLVLPHNLESMTEELAQALLEAGKENLFDPILLEPRGIGCSEKLPADKKEWNNFTAEKVAGDAEVLRKKLLKDNKWKVWTNQQSAIIALKMVELNPSTIQSLHIADFTFSTTPLAQEKLKLKAQIEAWKKFKEFSKENELEITADLVSKIQEVLLQKSSCPSEQRICKLDLMTSLIDSISGDDSQWKEAMKAIKLLSEGNIPNELNQIAQKNQKDYLYNQLLTAAHLDSDEYLTACEKALNDNELKAEAEVTPIKSCVMDRALKNSYLSELRGKIKHKKLDFPLIQKNLKTSNIDLYLVVGERSLLNPLISVSEMAKMLTGASDLENLLTPESGTDLFFDSQLLESLK